MQKTKPYKSKSHISASTSLEIRSRANALPVKSLIYAITHAVSDPSIEDDAKNDGISRRVQLLSRHLNNLTRIADLLNRSGTIRPEALYGTISSAATSYVNLFYAMRHSTRSSFIARCYTGSACKRIKPENNLLVMPAVMATRKEKRNKVSDNIIGSLYSMPLRFVYKHSKAAMHVELLQKAIAVKSISDSTLRRFSSSLKKIDALIGAIENGAVDPTNDELLKELFIDEIVEFSNSEDLTLADFLSEKLLTNSVNFRIARRIIRK